MATIRHALKFDVAQGWLLFEGGIYTYKHLAYIHVAIIQYFDQVEEQERFTMHVSVFSKSFSTARV